MSAARHFALPLVSKGHVEDAMINNYNAPGRLERPRAFRTDPSWYEAYWYREPEPRRPIIYNRSIARLVDAFQRISDLVSQFANTILMGAVGASHVIRERQSRWCTRSGNPTCEAKQP